MSSSKALHSPAVDMAPPGSRGDSSYTRFIPREELAGYAAWCPTLFGDAQAPPSITFTDFTPAPPAPTGPESSAPHTAGAPLDGQAFRPGLTGAWPTASDNRSDRGNGAHAQAGVEGAAHGGGQQPQHAPLRGDSSAGPATDADADAEAAWRDAVRQELQQELLGEWQEAAEAELDAQVHAARQSGYQDGYRDGLVALDSFKQSYAQQVTAQVSQLLVAFDHEMQGLERQVADSVVRVATQLARQVVRSELSLRPALVARVAQEAVGALLKNARHVTIALHPDDQALVREGCGDALLAANAQLVASDQVERGGCRVESDMGSIDACIATRWQLAARALGSELPWADDEAQPGADA